MAHKIKKAEHAGHQRRNKAWFSKWEAKNGAKKLRRREAAREIGENLLALGA